MSSNPPFNNLGAPGKALKATDYQRTIKALTAYKYLNRREISKITNLEIPMLCKTLFNFVKRRSVRVAFRGKCPATGKWVYYYSLTNQEGQLDGK
jgi:hypothetical protein